MSNTPDPDSPPDTEQGDSNTAGSPDDTQQATLTEQFTTPDDDDPPEVDASPSADSPTDPDTDPHEPELHSEPLDAEPTTDPELGDTPDEERNVEAVISKAATTATSVAEDLSVPIDEDSDAAAATETPDSLKHEERKVSAENPPPMSERLTRRDSTIVPPAQPDEAIHHTGDRDEIGDVSLVTLPRLAGKGLQDMARDISGFAKERTVADLPRAIRFTVSEITPESDAPTGEKAIAAFVYAVLGLSVLILLVAVLL